MAEKVTVYHPALKTTKKVPAGAVPVLAKSGWSEDAPRIRRRPTTKTANERSST